MQNPRVPATTLGQESPFLFEHPGGHPPRRRGADRGRDDAGHESQQGELGRVDEDHVAPTHPQPLSTTLS